MYKNKYHNTLKHVYNENKGSGVVALYNKVLAIIEFKFFSVIRYGIKIIHQSLVKSVQKFELSYLWR